MKAAQNVVENAAQQVALVAWQPKVRIALLTLATFAALC